MSLESRLAAFIAAVGADIKLLKARPSDPWTTQSLGDTTYSNATLGLTDIFPGFAPVPNKNYEVRSRLICGVNVSTTGMQTVLAGPANAERAAVKISTPLSASTEQVNNYSDLNQIQTMAAGYAGFSLLCIEAVIDFGPSILAGNVRVQARSEVAATNAVRVYTGSFMSWREI